MNDMIDIAEARSIVTSLIGDNPTGPRRPNMFHIKHIGYSPSCREFNEQVSTRQVRRHDAVQRVKQQRAAMSGMTQLAKRLRKRGIVFEPGFDVPAQTQ